MNLEAYTMGGRGVWALSPPPYDFQGEGGLQSGQFTVYAPK